MLVARAAAALAFAVAADLEAVGARQLVGFGEHRARRFQRFLGVGFFELFDAGVDRVEQRRDLVLFAGRRAKGADFFGLALECRDLDVFGDFRILSRGRFFFPADLFFFHVGGVFGLGAFGT